MILYARPIKEKSTELPLDTSAKLYVYTKTKSWNQTYRVSAVMKNEVLPQFLAEAIKLCKKRFPSFYVCLDNGFRWKKFETVENFRIDDVLVKDTEICRPVEMSDNVPLFRVLYSGHRISLEIFHGVTDGHGALVFLKTLLAVYLNLTGIHVLPTNGVLDINERPHAAELEDSFLKNYNRKAGFLNRNEKAAFQYTQNNTDNKIHIAQCRMSASKLKCITHRINVTVTQYLTAAYIYALCLNGDKSTDTKAFKVQVPIDIRPYFNSNTLRNFSLYTNVGIDAKSKYTFNDILLKVLQQIRCGEDETRIRKMLNSNVRDAEMPVSKIMPGFIKKPFIEAGFLLFGERLYTSTMSNLGVVDAPEEMKKEIEYFDFVIGLSHKNNIYSTVATFNDTLCVTISSKFPDNKAAETLFGFLRDQGLDIVTEYYR